MKIITEETPSSGERTQHEHKWQRVNESTDGKYDCYVCSHESCPATKLVPKPTVVESKGGKPLLLG